MQMPKSVLLTFSGVADPSRLEEFREWYDTIHLKEVVETPGFVSARRLESSDTQRPSVVGEVPGYLAIYELDTDDLPGAMQAMQDRVKAGLIQGPPEGLIKQNTEYEPGIFEVQATWPGDAS
jgi:hypothetical protein